MAKVEKRMALVVALETQLADAHISAIWYAEGEHNHVEEILELLTYRKTA